MSSTSAVAVPLPWGRKALARLVSTLHTTIIAFFLTGWTFPWRGALWGVVLGGVALQGIWRIFEDRCPLTILEERLRGEPPPLERATEDEEAPMNFVSELLTRILGRPIPHRCADATTYGVLYASMTISAVRLYLWS